ncbi:hypothetical protein D3C79_856770 [compost metagenome]
MARSVEFLPLGVEVERRIERLFAVVAIQAGDGCPHAVQVVVGKKLAAAEKARSRYLATRNLLTERLEVLPGICNTRADRLANLHRQCLLIKAQPRTNAQFCKGLHQALFRRMDRRKPENKVQLPEERQVAALGFGAERRRKVDRRGRCRRGLAEERRERLYLVAGLDLFHILQVVGAA